MVAKPSAVRAPRPSDDEDDFILPVNAPTPVKAAPQHPVKDPSGGQVLSRQGGKEPGQQGVYAGKSKLGARIPTVLKMRLKIASAVHGRTEESIVIEAVTAWLDAHESSQMRQ